MKLKKIIIILFLSLSGPILLILSEFFTWFSPGYNLIELYVLFTDYEIENSFLYLFPLISGTVCLIANILVIYKAEYKNKSIILSFMGLGFQIIFFIDHIAQEIEYVSNAGVGLYLGVIGFLLILLNIVNILTTVENTGGG
ncbi:MAG: hypothetical protein ACFE8B_00430 [Candidatus Hermodarchaeota archaeon]